MCVCVCVCVCVQVSVCVGEGGECGLFPLVYTCKSWLLCVSNGGFLRAGGRRDKLEHQSTVKNKLTSKKLHLQA